MLPIRGTCNMFYDEKRDAIYNANADRYEKNHYNPSRMYLMTHYIKSNGERSITTFHSLKYQAYHPDEFVIGNSENQVGHDNDDSLDNDILNLYLTDAKENCNRLRHHIRASEAQRKRCSFPEERERRSRVAKKSLENPERKAALFKAAEYYRSDPENRKEIARKQKVIYDNSPIKEVFEKANDSRKRRIKCLETGDVFESINAAARKFGLSPGNVSAVINGRIRSTKGYRFEEVEQK